AFARRRVVGAGSRRRVRADDAGGGVAPRRCRCDPVAGSDRRGTGRTHEMIDIDSAQARPPDVHLRVVRDIEQHRVAARALLGRPGVRVLTASGGIEALEVLLEDAVALALVDVQMPGLDGFELAELLRGAERTRAIPIIFVTAAPID